MAQVAVASSMTSRGDERAVQVRDFDEALEAIERIFLERP
jgi:hypothetical protein